jgi:hypothetical protein
MNAGLDSEVVKFYINETDSSYKLVGEREVWAWPFPEVTTVARQLGITGDSGALPDNGLRAPAPRELY